MSEPLISVVIPNYNYAKYIAETVESVLAQTYARLEVIVVDDASTDDSLDVLKRFDGRVMVVTQPNQGVSIARNNGAAKASGEFLAFLDADDVWLPTKIDRQMQRFAEEPDLGMVHCALTHIDPHGRVVGENRNGMEGFVAHELLRFERGVVVGVGSTGLMPRSIFEQLGGFDHRLSTAADWDLAYRIASKHKIAFVDEPLVLYRVHSANMHGNIKVMERDMTLAFEKAFAGKTSEQKRSCYGNLYKTLSGSYFRAGDYRSFARTALKSLTNDPANLPYFLKYPLRKRDGR